WDTGIKWGAAASVRLHFQIRYRATAIDPLRYLPPQGSKPKC
ncbi:YgeR, partial [Salmonella enterica subsp. enterica serovar Inverness str. R8-3668]